MNIFDFIIHDREKVELDDILLDEDNRQQVQQLIKEHTYVGELLQYGLPVNHKVLLHGSSGCGKTMTAKAIAQALGKNILILNLSNIVSARIGETSQNIKQVLIKLHGKKLFYSWMNLIRLARLEVMMTKMLGR